MLRANPVSLNAISYDAVIRALEIIRSGRIPSSSSKKSADELDKNTLGANRTTKESSEAPIVTDVFIDTVGDPAFYKSRLVQALGDKKQYLIHSVIHSIISLFVHSIIQLFIITELYMNNR